jgi:hypothetical protein
MLAMALQVEQEVQAVVVTVVHLMVQLEQILPQGLQILEEAVAVLKNSAQNLVHLVGQALSLFVMRIHFQQPHQLQVHRLSQ